MNQVKKWTKNSSFFFFESAPTAQWNVGVQYQNAGENNEER